MGANWDACLNLRPSRNLLLPRRRLRRPSPLSFLCDALVGSFRGNLYQFSTGAMGSRTCICCYRGFCEGAPLLTWHQLLLVLESE
uniref:Uncharacterized protein n=1 Tax=Arundo donax TaxID=35708 RepID=A0A0A8XQL6_ARUDO